MKSGDLATYSISVAVRRIVNCKLEELQVLAQPSHKYSYDIGSSRQYNYHDVFGYGSMYVPVSVWHVILTVLIVQDSG